MNKYEAVRTPALALLAVAGISMTVLAGALKTGPNQTLLAIFGSIVFIGALISLISEFFRWSPEQGNNSQNTRIIPVSNNDRSATGLKKHGKEKKVDMKNKAFACVLITGLLALLSGCSPLGPETTKYYDISDFNAVEAGGDFEVNIVPSENYSVSVTTNDNFINYIQVSKTNKTLKIETKGVNLHLGSKFKARVMLPDLRALKISGASIGIAHGFKPAAGFKTEGSGASRIDIDVETGNFTADISGASRIQGRLKADNANINASGAGQVSLEGSSQSVTIELSGGSSGTMPMFTIEDAEVQLSGASHASFNVNRQLDIHLSGGSALDYGGNPTLRNVDVSGGSSLRHK